MRKINELIWHCAATPEGKNFTVDDIDRWHRARGWSGIGYHKVVYLDGSVHEGRPESDIGAHVAGRNRNTIGYCYIGGVDANDPKKAKDTRTPAQQATMLRLTEEAIRKYSLKKVSGHNKYAAKACPCFDAEAEYRHLLNGGAPEGSRKTGDRKPEPKKRRVAAVLRLRSTGEDVRRLQKVLRVVADGIFGPITLAALRAYQEKHDLTVDGIAGPQTLGHMGLA